MNITCSLCQSEGPAAKEFICTVCKEDGNYQLRRCGNCGHVYTWFDREIDLTEYYDGRDYAVRDTSDSVFFKIQRFEYAGVIARMKKLCGATAPHVLDFGSGKGLFLHFAKEAGCRVKGIESSAPRAAYAREQFGLDIDTKYYAEGPVSEENFDVITSFHVLEHITGADALFARLVGDNLRPGGLVIIEVPNFSSWQSSWSGRNWLHLDVPRHLSHFTPQGLRQLAGKAGCTVVGEEYFSWHLGIIGMVQTIFSLFGYKGFLIGDLKERRSTLLLLKIAVALPFAFLAEALAAACKSGAVIRLYARYQPNQ